MNKMTKAATTTASPTNTTTKLTLVRHGQTEFNVLRRLQGACDSPLTQLGAVGVRVTAQHLSTQNFDAAYTSPQPRALTTATELLRHHDGLRPRLHAGLRELDFGDFERMPEQDMERVYPWAEFVPAMLTGRHPGTPGGESGSAFMRRVRETFAEIAAAHPGEHVLVVGHGLTLGAYLAVLGAGDGLVALPNASVTRIVVGPYGLSEVLELATDVAGHGHVAARPAPALPPRPGRPAAPGLTDLRERGEGIPMRPRIASAPALVEGGASASASASVG